MSEAPRGMYVEENDCLRKLDSNPKLSQTMGNEVFNDYSTTVERLFGSHRLPEGYLKSLTWEALSSIEPSQETSLELPSQYDRSASPSS